MSTFMENKVRTTPVLISHPKQVQHSPKRGFVFTVYVFNYCCSVIAKSQYFIRLAGTVGWEAVHLITEKEIHTAYVGILNLQ